MSTEPQKELPEVRLSKENMVFIEQRVHTSVTEAMKSVIDKDAAEKFWLAGFEMFKASAATVSGNIILGSFKKLMKQIGFVLLAILAIYAVGGISGLMAVVKIFFSRLE